MNETEPSLQRLETRNGTAALRFVRGLVVAVTACLLLACAACTSDRGDRRGAAQGQPLPDIVFVMVDTLRADRLGVLGGVRDLTPAMDVMATEGVLFERATAPAPWTLPSIASLFTGQHPGVHGVTDYSQASSQSTWGVPGVPMLGAEFRTLAEFLSGAGYATAGIVSNRFILAKFGFAQGFDHFDTSLGSNETPGGTVNKAAFEWLDAREGSKPFFLYLHYMDVHSPYTGDSRFLDPLLEEVEQLEEPRILGPSGYKTLGHLRTEALWPGGYERHAPFVRHHAYWLARYDAGVKQIDFFIDELRQGLVARDLWDQSLVIVTSDHGESLWEHGFWDHGLSLFEPELQVPLLMRWPGRISAGRRVPQRISLVDLLPTLLDQLRIESPAGIQGRSLVPLLEGQPFDERPNFYEALVAGREQKAVESNAWKLIDGPLPRLFELARDPGETNNLAKEHPERLRELRHLIDAHMEASAKLSTDTPVKRVPLTDADVRRLKALGYIN